MNDTQQDINYIDFNFKNTILAHIITLRNILGNLELFIEHKGEKNERV